MIRNYPTTAVAMTLIGVLILGSALGAEVRPERRKAERQFRWLSKRLGLTTSQVARIRAIMNHRGPRVLTSQRYVRRSRLRLRRMLGKQIVDLGEVRSELEEISRRMTVVHYNRIVLHRQVETVLTGPQRALLRKHRVRMHRRHQRRVRMLQQKRHNAMLRSRSKLGLSEEQYARIAALLHSASRRGQDLRGRTMGLHNHIEEAAEAPRLDKPALQTLLARMGAVKVERRMVRIETSLKVARLLNADQRRKWKKINGDVRRRYKNGKLGALLRPGA